MTDQEMEQDQQDRKELERRITQETRKIISELAQAEDFWEAMQECHEPLKMLMDYWKAFRAEWFDPSCYR